MIDTEYHIKQLSPDRQRYLLDARRNRLKRLTDRIGAYQINILVLENEVMKEEQAIEELKRIMEEQL